MARHTEIWSERKFQRARDLLKTQTVEATCSILADEFGGSCSPAILRNRMDAAGEPWPGR